MISLGEEWMVYGFRQNVVHKLSSTEPSDFLLVYDMGFYSFHFCTNTLHLANINYYIQKI